ncbi:MAG: aldose 1-epimerase [Flaviramulus sp.]|nr:aldose 1-epimerase [Flaviramulus sp.]
MNYTSKLVKGKNNNKCLVLASPKKTSFAKIFLNQGASLQELKLKGEELIKDMYPLTYNNSYASSILFPFANRIKDGSYQFNGITYKFYINEKELNNALHGLVFNKTFEVLDISTTDTFATVKLKYNEERVCKGFPFTYSIFLEYLLTDNTLDVNVEIINTDTKMFPFTLGWHPYFFSEDLSISTILFDAKKKLKLDDRNIAQELIINEQSTGFKINNQFLDDCFILDSNQVIFKTPRYNLTFNSTEDQSFLQLYTPPHKNTIAIEPTTGVSDSFNNSIGLKVLKPNTSYHINWKLKIDN